MSRQRFFFNLGALGAAGLLIVAAAAFGPGAVKGIGLGIGIAGCALSLLFIAVLMHHRHFDGTPSCGSSVVRWDCGRSSQGRWPR